MDRAQLLAASHDEVRRLAGQRLSEVTPSRRDFAMFVTTHREDLAVIARLAGTPAAWNTARLVAHARACDDADVAALAVVAGAGALSMEDLAAVAEATTAPILREYPIVHPSQLHDARLHGADAAVFPASDVDRDTLQELVATASSLHMAAVIEVLSATDVEVALRLAHVMLGVRCTLPDGGVDVARTRQLAEQIPRQCPVIVLAEVRLAPEFAALRGGCDAVVVGEALHAGDLGAALRELTGR